ncbi:tRNA (adenosine(37)-N6)-threonylcarbamoyltransferase complex transferase subunit TsaD [Thermosyntropha sp.]|uniref:tRNA (adenosine(37)-N6)-threonylcarbamoyltransferase complex transferase subunit TsaD n=1 Tax=Thermosyntropha sp. TaxID=2740820 RepID=UPI0025F5CDAE|nr:tRNA (adenosine(37)-N6)-threonylcarbamoyltransferase complex transferase subunit TsaD [Thermosyntropha sp.]MBO8158258.1 tRNA (adenosine(37)-N6)-threonylcarbamoyltransferase complex transferase subunit TsaD [Thermosyntropha sp.]
MQEVKILGIETSCDETAASIVKNGKDIMSNVVNSQIKIHQAFGGVVPEVASRRHIENIALVVDTAFKEAGLSYEDIDAVAVTNRPGLIGALLVGVSFAKGFAYGLNKPLIAVNHLYGHIYANFLEHSDIRFPAVCLVVSGGHTSLLVMKGTEEYELIGETLDDAAGEAFDKVARFMNLGYPGGPAIQKAAEKGQAGKYSLPRVFLDRDDFDFSFSGLKTAAMNLWNKLNRKGEADVYDMAAEFQAALVEVLAEKTVRAAKKYNAQSVMLAGGVAANSELRRVVKQKADKLGLPLYYPSLKLCTDNAAMIAGSAYHRYLKQDFAPLNLNAYATMSIL